MATTARAAGDPGLVAEQGQVGDLGAGHRVVIGKREADLVVEQLDGDEHVEVLFAAPEVRALIGEGHRQVAFAGSQRREGLRRLGLGKGHLDLGVTLFDQGQGAGDKCRRGGGERHQPDPAGAEPGDRGDLLLCRIEGCQHPHGMPRQHLASLGEAHLAPDALDQHGAGALLEAAHHLRDGGLRVAHRNGSAGEASFVGDRAHHA